MLFLIEKNGVFNFLNNTELAINVFKLKAFKVILKGILKGI